MTGHADAAERVGVTEFQVRDMARLVAAAHSAPSTAVIASPGREATSEVLNVSLEAKKGFSFRLCAESIA